MLAPTLAFIACAVAGGCWSEPLCSDDDPVSTATASNVQLEVRGARRAGLPVFIQDRTGAVIEEGTTDANGMYVVALAPADAALSIAIEPDVGEYETQLVTYLGLESDETLVVRLRPYRESDERASVTVRFPQLDVSGVTQYQVDLGGHCGAAYPIAHDASQPNRVHEVTIEARCFGSPGRAVVTAASDADDSFVGAASAALDLHPDDDVTVDVGPWESATSELRFVGEFPAETRGVVAATWADVVVHVDQIPVVGGTSVTIPNAPSSFDGVELSIPGPQGMFQVKRTTLDSFEIDSADYPPAIEAIEVNDLEGGAPRIAWQHQGNAAAAVAYFSAESTGGYLSRRAIQSGNPCHIQLPPLPPRYAALIPRYERELSGGVILVSGPSLDAATARRQIGAFSEVRAPDLPVFTVSAGRSIHNYPPDPS